MPGAARWPECAAMSVAVGAAHAPARGEVPRRAQVRLRRGGRGGFQRQPRRTRALEPLNRLYRAACRCRHRLRRPARVLDLLGGDALASAGIARRSVTLEGGGFYRGFGCASGTLCRAARGSTARRIGLGCIWISGRFATFRLARIHRSWPHAEADQPRTVLQGYAHCARREQPARRAAARYGRDRRSPAALSARLS